MSDITSEKKATSFRTGGKDTPSPGDVCTVGAYSFVWTEDHRTREQLDHLKRERDEVGAAALDRIYDIHQKRQEEAKAAADAEGKPKPSTRIDLMSILQEYRHEDKAMQTLWDELHAVPEWVDWEQIERAQRIFYRHALVSLIGFAFQGFVGETSGSTSAVAVLLRTGGFGTKLLKGRLLETFQFLLEITHSPEYIKPGGKAHLTAMRVRLIHSMAQKRICMLAEQRPGYFDFEEHGIPINLHDSVHSITTFSCNPIFIQMPLMGIHLSEQELTDYVALFRYVAHLMGTPTEYFDTYQHGKTIMESIAYNELQVTDTSAVVGYNFVESFKDLPPANLSAQFIEAGARKLNGDVVCDHLGFGRPGWYPYACFQGHCWLVQTMSFLQHTVPGLDDRAIDFFRDILHRGIIHSKAGLQGGSKYDFQYLPDGRVTGKEGTDRKLKPLRFYERPLELVYFVVFLLGCLTIGAGLALGAFVSYFLIRRVQAQL